MNWKIFSLGFDLTNFNVLFVTNEILRTWKNKFKLKSIKSFLFCNFSLIESKNQEAAEQDTNGGAKTDLTALQNHNLLIALAHGGTSGSPFAMPVSLLKNYGNIFFRPSAQK